MTTGKYDIDSKDFDLEDCMAQAQQGNPDAQVSIAFCYILGINGLEEDESKGFEYLQKCFTYLCKSAESGEGRSMACAMSMVRGLRRTTAKPMNGTASPPKQGMLMA